MSGTLYLTSNKNVLKRHSSSGSTNMAAPKTAAYSLIGLYVTNLIVPHNLGQVPAFRVYYEPFGDGVIWPPLADRNTGFASKPTNLSTHGPGLVAWADSTNLYVQLFYFNNTLSGTYPVYYVIYKDFSL